MPKLILLRHGQSRWNIQQRFTGWVDVDLTEKGEAEALAAGRLIKAEGLAIDRVFVSVLTRAIRTADLALWTAEQLWVPMVKDWRLNERHYGALTGLNKEETAQEHGAEQVHIWRRSYDIPPPPMASGGPYDFANDRRYAGAPIPNTTLDRVLPYWTGEIAPRLAAGETVLVAAHGNSNRAIIKHLFQVPDDTIVGVEIPTGNPLLVDLDANLKPLRAAYLDESRAEATPEIP